MLISNDRDGLNQIHCFHSSKRVWVFKWIYSWILNSIVDESFFMIFWKRQMWKSWTWSSKSFEWSSWKWKLVGKNLCEWNFILNFQVKIFKRIGKRVWISRSPLILIGTERRTTRKVDFLHFVITELRRWCWWWAVFGRWRSRGRRRWRVWWRGRLTWIWRHWVCRWWW